MPGHNRLAGGDWTWYGLFGVFFGMALASRINLAPLAAEIVVAAVIAYAKDWTDRKKDLVTLATEAGLRLALAGVLALLTFRVTQPMSFRAPTGDTTILTLHLNPEWTASVAASSNENSGIGAARPASSGPIARPSCSPGSTWCMWGMGCRSA